ncbi:MAG: FkbM family methyltransferase [Pikeienuella sp.]
MSLQIYVINRSVDTDRLAQFSNAAEKLELTYTRINAFDGHRPDAPWFLYRDLIGDQFWGEEEAKPGALACYISHIAAWQRVVADNLEMALICEDDTILRNRLTELRADARRNEGFDVIFANERMVSWRDKVARKGDKKLVPAGKVVERMVEQGASLGADGLARAPGADAYLISRKGAEKLLQAVKAQKICAGVDWAMLGRGLSADIGSITNIPEVNWLSENSEPDNEFVALIAKTAVSDQLGGTTGGSVLDHSTKYSINELKNRSFVSVEGDGQETGSHAMFFPQGADDDPVFQALRDGRVYEAPALEMMKRWMPAGGVFVDIGAHTGLHSVFMLRYGGAKLAVPIECNRRITDSLTTTFEANHLSDRVDLSNLGFGAWSDRGRKEQIGPKRNPFEARLREGFVEDVRVRPGHSLLREHKPDLIKIDVNGEEREVLKGLRRVIKKLNPLIALDLTRPKSAKSLPLLERLHYEEVESANWREAEEDKTFSIFRHTSQLN